MDDEREKSSVVTCIGNVLTNMDTTMTNEQLSSVIINIPPSSPRSPRLAHLRPPSPLTPEAMRQINLLTVQEGPVDTTKLSPISPAYATSDLGSSPRSSISVTTTSSLWSSYREHKKSSSDFTDADSDICKDLFSPSIMLSPAPFSPFSDHAEIIETPAFSDPTSTPMGQRLRFTFDPKSPSFLPLAPSRSSHFLLPPQPTLGVLRERSRSDSDTSPTPDSSNDDSSSVSAASELAASGQVGVSSGASISSKLNTRRHFEGHKHLYKKRLLRKYNEETNADVVSVSLANTSMMDSVRINEEVPSSVMTMAPTITTDDEPSAPKSVRATILLDTSSSSHLPSIVRHDPPACISSISVPSPSAPVSPTSFVPLSSLGLSISHGIGGSTSPLISKSIPASLHTISPNSNVIAGGSLLANDSANMPLHGIGGGNLSNQTYFDLWLKQQLLAVNSLWYPTNQCAVGTTDMNCGLAIPLPTKPFLSPFSTGPSTLQQQYVHSKTSATPPALKNHKVGSPTHALDSAKPQRHMNKTTEPAAMPITSSNGSSFGPIKSRRSRSESDMCYVCQHCGQAFSLHDRLAKHVASRHRDRSTSNESPLKSHKCAVCNKAFGRSDMLTRHMRLHTGIKPYACRVCGQVFSRSDHLSTHHRTHTGERPYRCPVCPYAASRRDMITRHMRTHSRSGSGDNPSTSPASSSSSLGGTMISGNSLDDHTSATASYVSVIRRAYDSALLAERTPSMEDLEEVDSQFVTPRVSADSSGRASAGSVSTLLCGETEEGMVNPLTGDTLSDGKMPKSAQSLHKNRGHSPSTADAYFTVPVNIKSATSIGGESLMSRNVCYSESIIKSESLT